MDSQNVSLFVSDHYVRSSWIAFFTLWVLWGFTYFVRHAFGHDTNKATPATNEEDPEASAKKASKWKGGDHSFSDRLSRAHEVLFENTLLLLSALILNTLGVGATRAVMILSWIFFGFTALSAFTEVGYKHHFVRLVFNLVFYGVTLAIGGLAFARGW